MADRGRPKEYTPEMVTRAREYLDSCEDEEIQKVKLSNEEKGYEAYENKLRVNLPTIEGLANALHIHRDTVYSWEQTYPDFSDVISELRQKQAKSLINNGLSGDYNPTIAKVLLAKHGYRESQEIEHSGELKITTVNYGDADKTPA